MEGLPGLRRSTRPSNKIRNEPVKLKKMDRTPTEMALSNDIVMDIVLSYLKVRDLLSCRLVSKFWYKAASSVIRKRPTMMKNISYEGHLMELKNCIERSLDFPFNGLRSDSPWKLKSGEAMEFFKTHGDKFTHLCLDTKCLARLQQVAPFINHLPRLSILEVRKFGCTGTRLHLSAQHEDDKDSLRLPSVRTLRISPPCPDIEENALREVLTAASPSLQIECLHATPDILRLISGCGKLGAVSIIKFVKDSEDYFGMGQYLAPTESLNLTELSFNVDGDSSLDWLKKALNSSQDTLRELHLEGKYLFKCSWSELPVLTKLTKLSLLAKVDFHNGNIFDGCDGRQFPTLEELQLNIKYKSEYYHHGLAELGTRAVLSTGFLVVPSVTKIMFDGYIGKCDMKELARSFPNVTEIRLDYAYYSSNSSRFMPCGLNPLEIWNVHEFEHLEKLRVWNYIIKPPTSDYSNMDRFLTGIPVETCEKLSRRRQKPLDVSNSLSQEVIRDNPNILQLKNLKELMVCVKAGNRIRKLDKLPFMSMVSLWYALEMMPNLRAKFVYEVPRPPLYLRSAQVRVLNEAFKPVKKYVKPEPFYY